MKLVCHNVFFLAIILVFYFSMHAMESQDIRGTTCWGCVSEKGLSKDFKKKTELVEDENCLKWEKCTTREDTAKMSNAIYRPSCAVAGEGENKKTIQLVYDLKEGGKTYISLSEGEPHKQPLKEVATYFPENKILYTLVRANKEGNLIAAGYDKYGNDKIEVNCIDILRAHNRVLKKVGTIALPQSYESKNILNMKFALNNLLFTRTQTVLYALDIDVLLQYHAKEKNCVQYTSKPSKDQAQSNAFYARCLALAGSTLYALLPHAN